MYNLSDVCSRAARVWRCEHQCHLPVLLLTSFVETYFCEDAFQWLLFHLIIDWVKLPSSAAALEGAFQLACYRQHLGRALWWLSVCRDFKVSTPVLSQILYHEIGKVNTGIVQHWMPARESCLTRHETDPGSWTRTRKWLGYMTAHWLLARSWLGSVNKVTRIWLGSDLEIPCWDYAPTRV